MPVYGQYCPVARALEVLGDRWSLLIVRELLFGRSHFNEIERGLPGISRSLLVQRLRLLEQGGALERRLGPDGRAREYLLTPAGRELRPLIETLRDWGARWAFDAPRPAELDCVWLLGAMLHFQRTEALPARRLVLEFRVRGGRPSHLWLLLERTGEGEVCVRHPGFDPDLVISADATAFFEVWYGRLRQGDAEKRGLLQIEAAQDLKRAFPTWFHWPSLPETVRPQRLRLTDISGR